MVIGTTGGETANQEVIKDSLGGEMRVTPFFVSFSFVRKERPKEYLLPTKTLNDDLVTSSSTDGANLKSEDQILGETTNI